MSTLWSLLNDDFWSRVIVVGLAAITVLFALTILVRKSAPGRRAKRDLRFMAKRNPRFEWQAISKRARDCFYRKHAVWGDESLSGVPQWMSAWYWQNRQQVELGKLAKESRVRVCDVRKIKKLKPLLFIHKNSPRPDEGSIVVIAITAKMQDYIANADSGKIVKGNREYRDVESIWSLTLEREGWKVSDIEDASMAASYVSMISELPKIEETLEPE